MDCCFICPSHPPVHLPPPYLIPGTNGRIAHSVEGRVLLDLLARTYTKQNRDFSVSAILHGMGCDCSPVSILTHSNLALKPFFFASLGSGALLSTATLKRCYISL